MTNSAVTIGSISLRDFEVPASIRFGGRQRLVIHRLSDGTRRVEVLGPDDGEVRFEGVFSGPDAENRARVLNSLRLAGSVVWLTWQSFRYRVIIRDFSVVYHNRLWIAYRINCVIFHQSGVISSGLLSEQSLISGALSTAAMAVSGMPINLTSLSAAVAVSGALIAGTAAHSQASLLAGRSMDAVQQQINMQSEALFLSSRGPGGPSTAASSFATQLASTGLLANVVNARSNIGRVITSLKSLGG